MPAPSAPGPAAAPAQLWPKLSGPYVTLATVVAMMLLSRMLPVPDPAPVVLMAVVYAAFAGGWLSGMMSGGIALAYFAAFFAEPGQALTYTSTALAHLAVLAFATPSLVVMVGTLKRRAERAFDLQRQNERLAEMDALKTQFINNAAHELGTPLTPIVLQMQLLKKHNAHALDDKQQRALTILDRNIERLNGLVQDLLEVTRLQAGKLNVLLRAVDMDELAREAVDSFAEPARRAGVEVRYEGEPAVMVQADARRVIQVLFNLLNNALKFTPEGGRVSLRVERQGGAALVRVRDTGRGIEPASLGKLFQPFSQVHDTMEMTKPGAGLGLFICKGIVEQHGGRIWAESAGRGQGATFCFTLPLASVPLHEDLAPHA
jgi:signal transduction histidine kinase